MEEHDTERTVRDRLQPALEHLHLGGGLRVDRAEERLAEVRDRGAGEAADEALRPDDPDVDAFDLGHRGVALEHRDTAVAERVGDLAAPPEVVVVVPEHGIQGRDQPAARVGEDGRLLRVAVRRQVAGEEDQVGLVVDRRERCLEPLPMGLARVDVAGGGDLDRALRSVHGGHLPRIGGLEAGVARAGGER